MYAKRKKRSKHRCLDVCVSFQAGVFRCLAQAMMKGEDEGVLGGEIFTGDTVRKKEKGVQGLE